METKAIRYFLDSAGALFFAAAVALLIGIHVSAGFELPHDSLFNMPLRTVYWVFSGLAFGMAIFCLFSQKAYLKAALMLWMTVNVMVYALGVQWSKPNEAFSAYLSCVADAFEITPGTALWMAKGICFYLLIGSSIVLLLAARVKSREEKIMAQTLKMVCPVCGVHIKFARQNAGQIIPCPQCQIIITLCNPPLVAATPGRTERRQEALVRTLKIACTKCGGHIEFPTNFFGERIPCPHCQTSIILQKAAIFKMSCRACDGRIAFPAHAIGEKIPCPHCNMDIILKEPA